MGDVAMRVRASEGLDVRWGIALLGSREVACRATKVWEAPVGRTRWAQARLRRVGSTHSSYREGGQSNGDATDDLYYFHFQWFFEHWVTLK